MHEKHYSCVDKNITWEGERLDTEKELYQNHEAWNHKYTKYFLLFGNLMLCDICSKATRHFAFVIIIPCASMHCKEENTRHKPNTQKNNNRRHHNNIILKWYL